MQAAPQWTTDQHGQKDGCHGSKELGNWGRDSKHEIEQWCHCHRKHQSHQFPLVATEPRSTKCSQRCTRKEVVSGQVLLFKSRTQHQPYQWKLQQQNVGQRSPMDCRRNTHQHKGRQQCTCWQVLSLVWEVHKTTSFTATQRKVLEGCSLGYVGWWLSDDVCRATKNQFEIFAVIYDSGVHLWEPRTPVRLSRSWLDFNCNIAWDGCVWKQLQMQREPSS